ncbi:hypothetical protein C3B59_08015 [Cryobacterium zongtaii]|uniref:Uncharacterized protein n=1 Tax=Cryobacterium zongtaii TaxID=1259217 RepID=A0A2S3ZG71_9MICO|nr:hypothetical protein C3B59_08015 [Cryobacterium zongtaii]
MNTEQMPVAASEKLVKAQIELTDINARIDNHPLNSSPMRDAREVVAAHRDTGKDAIAVASEPHAGSSGKPNPWAATPPCS